MTLSPDVMTPEGCKRLAARLRRRAEYLEGLARMDREDAERLDPTQVDKGWQPARLIQRGSQIRLDDECWWTVVETHRPDLDRVRLVCQRDALIRDVDCHPDDKLRIEELF